MNMGVLIALLIVAVIVGSAFTSIFDTPSWIGKLISLLIASLAVGAYWLEERENQ